MVLFGGIVSTACGSESSKVGAVPTVELVRPETTTPHTIYATVVVRATTTAVLDSARATNSPQTKKPAA
ncbi:MAG: hypothetical protein HON31_05890 [Chloroflexi bacterium]|nr:hypothetical protein [Chloroflexota bacterium]